MEYEQGKRLMKSEIGRSLARRMFESLASDVAALNAKLALEMLDESGFIEGLELLLPRLRRFAPGRPSSDVTFRWERVSMSRPSEGEPLDETGNPGSVPG